MKRVVFLLFLFGLSFVSAVDQPSVSGGVGGEDVEAIQDAVEGLPIDPVTGEIYNPLNKTKAEVRIAEINSYIGPVTRVLWGFDLELSWTFIFAVILWLLLIEIIVMPVSEIFDWNVWWSLLGSGIIATLAMQGFGKNFVVWIDSLVTQWYVGAMAIVMGIVFGVLYKMAMKYFGKEIEAMKEAAAKTQTEQDREVIHANRKLSEAEIRAMAGQDVDKALS
ncbi:hypothetical protein HNV12_02675 [Methanococcoides sp. SA1]|nr:hypothetical protein [Methanococcoides sp. SA1]